MRHRFDKQGILAIDPKAFFALYAEHEEAENRRVDDVEIVDIDGPLVQRGKWWCDSYEAILARVATACVGSAKTIVLNVDSPGGDLAGMAEASRSIRRQCAEAGKRLVAYVDGHACSAAYALACAAQTIYASDTAIVGSIGVVSSRVDVTEADKAMGLAFSIVASGAKKLYGNPHTPVTEAEVRDAQGVVDSLASIFFGLVSEMRAISPDAIEALEAGCFHGEAAVKAGLVDEISTFDAMLESLAAGGSAMSLKANAEDIDEAKKALERAVEADDDTSARAKRALAALDGDDEEEDEEEESAESDDDEKKAESKDEPQAEDDGEKKSARAAGHVSADTATDMAATISALSRDMAELKAERASSERATLLASRPDIGKDLAKVLASKPLADVKQILGSIPKPKVPQHAATAVVQGTRGEGQTDSEGISGNAWLNEQMGLTTQTRCVRREGNAMIFDVPSKKRPSTEKVKP